MEGENRVTLLGKPEDGGMYICFLLMPQLFHVSFSESLEYVITMPNMYARGILFGKMVLELGDTCVAKNEKNGLSCDIEFKTKVILTISVISWYWYAQSVVQGFFSGTYNALAGKVRKNSTEIGEVSGRWSHVMEIKSTKVQT